MAHFGTGKVRHSNNKNSFINNENNGISVWTVQDEFFKAVIMPKDEKDPKNDKAVKKAARDRIYALAPKVAAEFEPGNYDTKDLRKRVHEVARQNGLKVRLSPDEIEELNAKRQEAAERRQFQAMLRKQEDEIASKVAIQFIRCLQGVRFRAGWQKEKCLRMCVNETVRQYTVIGNKVFENKALIEILDKCVKEFEGAMEIYNY